ncbi:MAG: VWA domain-containing protein [Cycloclasticus sp.]|nr:VWA domain-containing protein [Cycloclasticus sp.]MBQ0789128.1 VWA domain-containing protein [Cycloclasticus sp.]
MKKSTRVLHYFFLIALLAPSLAQAALFNKTDKTLEVRVLVDVSERMRVSDPDNHRLSALKLFIKLLPNNAQAGIWMFDGETIQIMKPSKSGISWKAQALKNITAIHSNGKRADLERAIAVATLEWVERDKWASRHLVLLTDGKITSGGTKRKNQDSKERVLNHQVENLKAADVSVHTIAFSEDADKEFLDAIASRTIGWFDVAKTADQLERAMLRVNKRLVEKNSIPLVANKFIVDDAVREFTAVVFRKKGFGSTQLDDPEGLDFGRGSKRYGVTWHNEKKFDIVTVTDPMEGEWRLIAAADPDNEVFITTNLQMAVDEMPKEIYAGLNTRVKMLLTSKTQLLTNSNFLNTIKASVEIKNKRGDIEIIDMQQDMINSGYFFADIGKELKVGPYEMVVKAVGNTVERIEALSFHVLKKPKVKRVEVKPIFKQVLADAGIVLPKSGLTEDQVFACPDLSKLLMGAEGCPVVGNQAIEEEAEEGSSWLITSMIVLLINLLLGAGGFFGFKWYKKKSIAEDEALVNKLSV